LTHSRVPGGGSVTVCFKSPLTNCWGEARCGGSFGIDMKKAGFDFIIIKGCSGKPVYLKIKDGSAEICGAEHMKAKDIYEKDKLMREAFEGFSAKDISTMCIGISGENLVRYAGIMCGDRAAGRVGGGAVMGSKNLVGIIVGGVGEIPVFDEQRLKSVAKETVAEVAKNEARQGLHDYGTMGDMPANDEDGDFPTKNWRSNSFGKGTEIFDRFMEKNLLKPTPCYPGCPVGCGRIMKAIEGKYETPGHEGGEYETIAGFTAFVMSEDVDLAVHCGYLCNKYGVDTISCASAIAFAMECYEKGIITVEDTGGVPFEWGSAEAILHGIEIIVNKRHIGAILADGVRAAAEKLGGGSEEFAIHIKGLEGPAHDPRSGKMLGVTYATGNRGMCHIHPFEGMAYDRGKMNWGMLKYGVPDPETMDRWDETGKGTICKTLQDGLSSCDILATCKFLMYAGVTLEHWADMLSALTGWEMEGTGILKISERAWNLQRLYNVREGLSRADDMLPRRTLSMPEFGAYADQPDCLTRDFNALLDEYYAARGWDLDTGVPSDEKLAELGLDR